MSRSDSSKPRISEVMPTIDVMPMTTPRMVNAERILLVRSVSNAITATSRHNPRLMPLLTSQRLDRVERCCPVRRPGPEEQADGGGDADAEHDGPQLETGRQGSER